MVSGSVVVLGVLLTLAVQLYASPAPLPPSSGGAPSYMHNSLPEVWEVLARHGALEAGHQLARKSARSPSRRLRFGRRSDPLMPPQPEARDLEELQEELLPEREVRAPVRMRFGRRSVELAVPHILPMPDDAEEDVRPASKRVRYGRRSNLFMFPYEQADRDFRANQELESYAEE